MGVGRSLPVLAVDDLIIWEPTQKVHDSGSSPGLT